MARIHLIDGEKGGVGKSFISQVVNNSNDSSSDEDNAINKKDVAVMAEQLSISPENLNALRDLIIHSFSDELVILEQELEIEMHNNHLHNEQKSAVNTTNITEIMNYFQREAAPKLHYINMKISKLLEMLSIQKMV